MPYQALYRTYRPLRFSDVIGQDHITRTLTNSIIQGKWGHAYLFCGPRGTGKTTIARILAKAINCTEPDHGEPCGKCNRCLQFKDGVGVLEIDAASHNSVDDIRTLAAQVQQVPLSGGMMVYIIDEAHMLSNAAFNAFLKTLEEPPPHAVFVLATTEPGKILPTIHSRCLEFDFRRVPFDLIAAHLKKICENEKVPIDDGALRLIVRAGDGSVRDSISVLEQAIAFEPDGLTVAGVRNILGIPESVDVRNLAEHIISGDPEYLSISFKRLIELGREPRIILTGLLSHFRDLMFAKINVSAELATLPDEEKAIVLEQAEKLSLSEIHGSIAFLAKAEGDIRYETEASLILEVSLHRLASGLDKDRSPVGQAPTEKVESPEATPEPARKPEKKSLTGGVTLKKEKKEKPVVAEPEKKIVESPSRQDLVIPKNLEPLWSDAMEAIREISFADYCLLAEVIPDPPPSNWHDSTDVALPLNLTLIYPPWSGLVVHMLQNQALVSRLSSRLEQVLERAVELSLIRDSSQDTTEKKTKGNRKPSLIDGEGPISNPGSDSPHLFPGGGRVAPRDPVQRQIHDLLIRDFPEYNIEEDSGTGNGTESKPI